MRTLPMALVALLSLTSCSFSNTVPENAQIYCEAGQGCPSHWVCVNETHTCVPLDSPELAAPSLSNPSLSPTLGRMDTTFELGFDLMGSLGGPPQAEAVGPATLSFLCSPCLTNQRCSCLLKAESTAPPDGQYQVSVQATDLLGHAVPSLSAGTLTLKSTPPPPPDTGPDAGLHLTRAPWGAAPTIGTFAMTLDSLGPAISEAGTLVVYGDAERQTTVTQVSVTPGPLPALALPPPDRAQVWVDLIDVAGNTAPGGPFLVHNVSWIGTLGNKVRGDSNINPHSCFGRGVATSALMEGDDAERELDAQTGPTGAAPPLSGTGRWRQRHTGTPAFSLANGVTLDPVHGQLATYGAGNRSYTDVWLFDGVDWQRQTGTGIAPTPLRTYPPMAYDSRRGKMVLYGDGLGSRRCWTWEFDGENWTLASTADALSDGGAPPAGDPQANACPGPGPQAELAYDSLRQQVVLLDSQAQLWSWNGLTWTHLPGDGTQPSGAGSLAGSMVWQNLVDGGGQLIAVGGGLGDGGNPIASNAVSVGTWMGSGYSWSQAFPSQCTAGQPGCVASIVTLDPATGDVLLAAQSDAGSSELWRWGGDPSQAFQEVGPLPPNSLRGISAAVLVPGQEGRATVVTGYDIAGTNPPSLDQTWSCSITQANDCQLLHDPVPRDQPAARLWTTVGFAPQGLALMIGGMTSPDSYFLSDTWLWTGYDWDLISVADRPDNRAFSGLAWYSPRQQLALTGGYGVRGEYTVVLQDLWLYDVDGGVWTNYGNTFPVLKEGTPISAEVPGLGTLVADATLSVITEVGDGGLDLQPVGNPPALLYDGNSMTSSREGQAFAVASPDPQGTAGDPFDLFGISSTGQATPLVADVAGEVTFSYPIYDDAAGRLLLFGTEAVRSWDGAELHVVEVVNPSGAGAPSMRVFPGVAYDPVRNQTLIFGGEDLLGSSLGETWTFDLAANAPAEVCRFSLETVGLPEGVGPAQVRVDVQAGAGNTAAPPGGATLELWRSGRWEPVAHCDAGDCTLDNPTGLSAVYQGQDTQPLLGDLGLLSLAVVPDAPNGSGQSEVRVQLAQVSLDYRLP